jgi:hypothetical protein
LLALALAGCGRGGFYFGFTSGGVLPDGGPFFDSGLPSCAPNQIPCGLTCVDPLTDNSNCGGCGNQCAVNLMACVDGTCQCFLGCGPGFTICPIPDGGCGFCADTTSDTDNCGGCGIACGQNERCVPQGSNGACVCDTPAPDGGDLIQCGSGCVHSDSDPLNCGNCGFQCQSGSCVGAMCVTAVTCNVDAGLFACTGTGCTDVTTDVQHCGSCGNDCTMGGTAPFTAIECFLGQCLCQNGQDYICPQDSDPFPTMACVDTSSDPFNCGGCGLLPDGGGPYPDGGLPPSPRICSGVRTSCQFGSCFCPNNELYCGPGTWLDDGGNPASGETCLNDTDDPFNCGGCGNDCATLYAADSVCQFASCTCIDGGICVTSENAADPFNPTCDCSGTYGIPNPYCAAGAGVTFLADIYPLLSETTVVNEPTWGQGAVLVGCAVSGCHDSTAAAGLQFTDPDASYQELTNTSSVETCNGTSMQIPNPSQFCSCQSLVIPGDGADSLLYSLLSNTFICANPIGAFPDPMPIDDGGFYHPLSACLATQVRQWIDQGAVY